MSIVKTTLHHVTSITIKDDKFRVEEDNPFCIRTLVIAGTEGKDGKEFEIEVELFSDGSEPAQLII